MEKGMRKLLLSTFVLGMSAFAQEFRLGSPVADFDLNDLKGAPVKYSALKGGTTVVIFIATQCPISNGYNERMKAVYNDYAVKGVHFVFINANNSEPAAEVEAHARSHGFAFPVYKDQGNMVADMFGAQVTPEAFVMDSSGIIRYHGYVDDSLNEARIHNQGLRLALDAVLAGKPVANAETKAFGCTIKRRRRSL
jgi:thiol-disulfide isomerase/thioredoxin